MADSAMVYVTGPDTGLRAAAYDLLEAGKVSDADMLEQMPLRLTARGKKKAGPTLRAFLLHTTVADLEDVMTRLGEVSSDPVPVRAVALPVLAQLGRGEWD